MRRKWGFPVSGYTNILHDCGRRATLSRGNLDSATGLEEGRVLLEKVRGVARRHRLFEGGGGVVVAVSGGPDSVALLDVLYRLRDEFNLRLGVAHLNHRIRGKEAEEDARFVRQLAERYGLPFTYGEEDVPRLAREKGMSLEEAAREARYAFLRRALEEQGAKWVALGHNRDDVIETVLLNLVRGTGLEGLAGMSVVREGIFVRPLIECSREEVEAYLKERGLASRLDSSNLDTAYLRNRIRHRLLPLLEREFSPKVRERLFRLAEMVREEVEALNEEVRRILFASSRIEEGRVAIPLGVLEALPQHLRRRLIRQAYLEVRGSLRDLDYAHVRAVLELLASRVGSEVHLPEVVAKRGYNFLILEQAGEKEAEKPFEYEVPVPGEVDISEAEVRLEATLLPSSALSPPLLPPDPQTALFDFDQLSPPLIVRSFRHGDRMRPHGLGGTKKVHDIFVDLKVPRERRLKVPLVCDSGGERILWVAGLVRSEHALVTGATKRVLILHLRR